MRVAIAGAGTTGAYAHRLLLKQGIQAEIYDKRRKTACGINPCAWGTSTEFIDLALAAGLDPETYILHRSSHLVMDDVRLSGEMMTFDKPAFIRDLLQGTEVRDDPLDVSAYDRVIDATGLSRSFLPPVEGDVLLPCVQRRVRTDRPLENRIRPGRIGYAWCFPLGKHGYHLGCGTLDGEPALLLKEVGWAGNEPGWETICACRGLLRLTGPRHSRPFVVDHAGRNVWGVGEAIGCVAPLAGDGIVPGMKSVRLLLEHWDDPQAYTKAVLKEFTWMRKEREVIDRLLAKSRLGIRDAWILKSNSRRMGVRVGLKEALLLLNSLR